MSRSSRFMKNWFAIEAIPIYAVVGLAVGGASWYVARLATRPDVIWTKSNPQPWNTVKPDENIKLMSVNQKFEKSDLRLDMVMPLDSPQPTFELPPLASIPDTPEEQPTAGLPLIKISTGTSTLPSVIFGGGSLSAQYNDDEHLNSIVPLKTVRTALRYGITAFDTSAYYGPSEIILGAVLKTLEPEFPRSSYQLMTKCGRYGVGKEAFDYSPDTVRRSIERSLKRMNTDYLDVVYLHDVEFIAEEIMPRRSGNHKSALGAEAALYGLAEGQERKIWGKGDQAILDAYGELRRLQSEGVIKRIGITGYPLPTLLRLAILILHSPPYKPVDILLSYSQSNLQNFELEEYIPHLKNRAQVGQLVSASPLNMGLLTPKAPAWHPVPQELKAAIAKAGQNAESWPGGLPNIAIGYSIRKGKNEDYSASLSREVMPIVIGLSTPDEVHETIKVWREVQQNETLAERLKVEEEVLKTIKDSGYYGWAWASPLDS